MKITEDNSFPFAQKLKSSKKIESLFEKGRGGLVYPVRYLTLSEETEASGEVSVMVSVSKKYHKKAVVRNLLKRRMREAYRTNKAPLREKYAEAGRSLSLALIYVSKEISDYTVIESAVGKIIEKLTSDPQSENR